MPLEAINSDRNALPRAAEHSSAWPALVQRLAQLTRARSGDASR